MNELIAIRVTIAFVMVIIFILYNHISGRVHKIEEDYNKIMDEKKKENDHEQADKIPKHRR